MKKKFKYAVVGAGRQGTASAYDLALNGNAELIYLIDENISAAEKAAFFVSEKSGFGKCVPVKSSATDEKTIANIFKEVDSVISAVPYYFNVLLTKLAVENGASFCDMGGNTEVVRKQFDFDESAKEKNVSVVPDTGMGPGLNISMIRYAFDKFEKPEEIFSYVGGLPLNPKPPWNYELIFNLHGLTNEYYGNAFHLREGKVVEIPALSEREKLDFKQFGKLEAAVTTGGLSTAPWYFEGKLKTLEYKTLRYAGHWDLFEAFSLLNLFSEKPVKVDGEEVIPRKVFHALLEPKLRVERPKDVGIMKIIARGKVKNAYKEFSLELVEEFDEKLGLTAMQKLTGWHSSVVAILSAKGILPSGVIGVESIPGKIILDELAKRGFSFKENWNQ